MRDALRECGRPIVFSICEWGSTKPWQWAPAVGNLWRTTGDISDIWECKKESDCLGVVQILDLQVGLESASGPGHWNDPDMLEVGNGGMTLTENQAHFSLWCLLDAPLMAGNDLRTMAPEIRDILTNKEVIAVNQDPLGIQGRKVRDDGSYEVWAKPLADGSRAVILLNRSEAEAKISLAWTEVGYPNKMQAEVRDVWKKTTLGKYTGGFSADVPAHGVVMIIVKP
jgi:alpha-galactosidase